MTVTEAIKAILSDSRCEMSAEIINQLHGCRDDHPWGKGKCAPDRKAGAVFAVMQAKHVPATLRRQLELSND